MTQKNQNRQTGSYAKVAVTTSSRGQILIMLYEGAIKNIRLAIVAIDNNDMAAKGLAIGKSIDIVNELLNTLNHQVNKELCETLEGLYLFCTRQLMQANIENSKKMLESVMKVLETLLEGWRGAVSQVEKGPGAAKGNSSETK